MNGEETMALDTPRGRPGAEHFGVGKFLTFDLAREHYGLQILKVREIIGMMDITGVPQTPAFVKGLINLRGKVIPVLDLRLKFGMEDHEYTERTSIIVVDVESETELTLVQMGIVVDTVAEVVNITPNDIEPTPNFGAVPQNGLYPRPGQGQRAGNNTPGHQPGVDR